MPIRVPLRCRFPHHDGKFFTPVSPVSLIAHVLGPEGGTVLDPARGSGGMFVQTARIVEEHGQSPTDRLTFPSLPQGERQPPMGRIEHTTEAGVSTRGRRLGWRTCLRKGCGRRFQAWHWRQRYCQEPGCLRELQRWQAAKRQRKRRATVEGRAKHAQAERRRRGRKKSRATLPFGSVREGGAWSRNEKILNDPLNCWFRGFGILVL